jgi:hypothetical protein
MRVNEQPLSAYGLEPVSSDGRVSFANGTVVIEEIPQTAGGQLLSVEFSRPRRVTVRLRIRGLNEKEFYTNRDAVADLLMGALEVRFTDIEQLAERVLYCTYESMTQSGGVDPEWLTPNRPFELVLVAADPFFYDRLPLVASVEEPLPVGTGPAGDFTTIIGGPSTNPLELVLQDFRGAVVNRIRWTAALAAGEWLEIRHQRGLVRKFTSVTSYVDASGSLDFSASDAGFFQLTPDLAHRLGSAWPTTSLVSGAPASVQHIYRRGWH